MTTSVRAEIAAARQERLSYEDQLTAAVQRRTEMELAATERRAALRRRATALAAGAAYVIGRIDAGDNRVDQADAEDFGEFYADRDGTWVTAADLFDQFSTQLSERDDS